MDSVVVIGGGVGGLTTAAVLARSGVNVTVLEAHIYPGGCAGTFYHQGYQFDAGATLAGGFYPGGPMDLVAREAGVSRWPAEEDDLAMVVHLPGRPPIHRWSDDRRWKERQQAFGDFGMGFFEWQERTADAVWELALQGLPWPPQTFRDLSNLALRGGRWALNPQVMGQLPSLIKAGASSMQAYLKGANDELRLFIDAQLLISAQATSAQANALYGAAALDLPRRGIAHLKGGMGTIASTLASAVEAHGGEVRYRNHVTKVEKRAGKFSVEVRRGDPLEADLIIFNLPPWNIRSIAENMASDRLHSLPPMPEDGWGAAVLYAGIDAGFLPEGTPLHHQVILSEPLGEGNSVYLSLSPPWDNTRAPDGKRAVTFSTHTNLGDWWDLYENQPQGYERRREQITEKMLQAAEVALPGFIQAVELKLPGTPVTFQRFTRRRWGWVGGFPQTSLFRAWGPRLAENVWMVGDSIFPGQSTASVALGGLRVAQTILDRKVIVRSTQLPDTISTSEYTDSEVRHVEV
ncbi:MAG: NAD(P)/FAD-dependent oxidoreductase [Anaerolineales bacterium]|jgi:C-3',4' desaturase CrtD